MDIQTWLAFFVPVATFVVAWVVVKEFPNFLKRGK